MAEHDDEQHDQGLRDVPPAVTREDEGHVDTPGGAREIADRYLQLALRPRQFTISGTWDRDPWAVLFPERDVFFYPESRQLFGVEWYAERLAVRAAVRAGESSIGAGRSIRLRATSPTRVERASWWRRWGYQIVKRWPA